MSDWVEHGEGVYVRHYESLSLNVGAVDCGDGLLIVDTRCHQEQARELRADLRRLSPLPVRRVVNTHHHWDHTFGNAEFLPASIWGHDRCAARLRDEGDRTRDRLKLLYGDAAAPLFDEVVITPPDHTFADRAAIECGSRLLDLRHLGLGHTDNDIVLIVDGGEVVFAGDLIEESAPPAYDDAFPLEWPATAARLLDLIGGAVVPGHGRVVDRGFVATQAAEISEIARLAAERHAAGMPAGDAARAGGPFGPATLTVAFRRAWEHLDRGDPAP
jgi:glyoxylase-like metal-dependent hydrolase (beta-lactamase superfamily II)